MSLPVLLPLEATVLGFTEGFYLGEFIGLTLIFVGFLASIEVFARRPWPLNRQVRARQTTTGQGPGVDCGAS